VAGGSDVVVTCRPSTVSVKAWVDEADFVGGLEGDRVDTHLGRRAGKHAVAEAHAVAARRSR